MKLVCITGIDGTGKTTLARGLTAALRDRGVPARYVYGRTYPIISRGLMTLGRLTFLRRHDLWSNYEAYTASKRRTMRSSLLARVYSTAILLDYYPQVWARVLPYLLTGQVVVCDRYLYDTVISDLAVHLNYSPGQTDNAIRRGFKLLPKPELTALLDVAPEVAFARKDDVPHVDYLKERRRWYLRLATRPEVAVFDADAPAERVLQRVLSQADFSSTPVLEGHR